MRRLCSGAQRQEENESMDTLLLIMRQNEVLTQTQRSLWTNFIDWSGWYAYLSAVLVVHWLFPVSYASSYHILILFLRNLFLSLSCRFTGSVQYGCGLSCCTCIQSPAPSLSGNSLSLFLSPSLMTWVWDCLPETFLFEKRRVWETLLYFQAKTQKKPKPLTKRYTSPKPRDVFYMGMILCPDICSCTW